jgi:hypothetical protein
LCASRWSAVAFQRVPDAVCLQMGQRRARPVGSRTRRRRHNRRRAGGGAAAATRHKRTRRTEGYGGRAWRRTYAGRCGHITAPQGIFNGNWNQTKALARSSKRQELRQPAKFNSSPPREVTGHARTISNHPKKIGSPVIITMYKLCCVGLL